MAHEHSILDIYHAKTGSVEGGGDGSVNIHNVPTKPWLGKTYDSDTVQRGATRESGLHANAGGDMPGYSLDGAGGGYFIDTQNQYDTVPNNLKFRTPNNLPDGAGLDDRAYQSPGGIEVGGDPTANPYLERSYVINAPGA